MSSHLGSGNFLAVLMCVCACQEQRRYKQRMERGGLVTELDACSKVCRRSVVVSEGGESRSSVSVP